ncbi:MAG: S-layer homology domain-containing protein [Tissierellia bacterium]|nr:S-layer homology domain-containing protein [Tissierellia bacterium]
MKRKSLLLFLIFTLLLSFTAPVMAQSEVDINAEVEKTANFLMNKVDAPKFGSIAGEWTILSLARSGVKLPENYIENYHKHIDQVVAGKNGQLSKNKFTEYSRLIVALTATDKDVTNVGGHNLIPPLGNFKDVIKQGINGPIWALIALDTKGFEIPDIGNSTDQNSRERMVEEILNREISGGGWALMGEKADVDITAMTLYSLVHYKDNPKVAAAIERGVNKLSEMQLASGGFTSMNDENSESTAQTIIALSTLGIDPFKDPRFIKTDEQGVKRSPVDALLTFRSKDGGFKHVYSETEANAMGTDQALEALVAAKRYLEGKPALFDMSDVGEKPSSPTGVFTDIEKSWAKDIILKTKGYGIAGDTTEFKPEQAIKRGEFAFGLVQGLGLTKGDKILEFSDVKSGSPHYDAIIIAASLGVIEGRGDGIFDPNATITREEAMAIVQRALKTKGVGQEYTVEKANELLKKFPDGDKVSSWAKVPAAFNIDKKIIEGRPEGIVPKGNITRAEAVKVILTATDVK